MPDFVLTRPSSNNPPGTGLLSVADLAAAVLALIGPADGFEPLLARTVYDPVGATTATTSSTTFVDVSAANLVITFTTPPSGNVRVVLEAQWDSGSLDFVDVGDRTVPSWALREGTTPVPDATGLAIAEVTVIANPTINAVLAARGRARVSLVVTGLTPGAHTWKFAHRSRLASGSTRTAFGGDVGPAIMEVYATA